MTHPAAPAPTTTTSKRSRIRRRYRDEPARAGPRLGGGPGRGRPGRSYGAAGADGAGVPRADGPRPAPPAVSAGSAVVHALAGAPRRARSAGCLAARQPVVAGGERAAAAGRVRDGRAAVQL